MAQAYGHGETFDWSPPAAGAWRVAVCPKNLGSPASREADAEVEFPVLSELPVTSVSLSADQPSPALLATVGTVRFTASATEGSGSYDYQSN